MFEIPLNLILINPAIDILLIISILYFFLFKLYKKLLDSDVEQIMWMDLKVSVILLLSGYLNYAGKTIDFFDFKMEWWFYIILFQFLIEGVFVFFNWKDTKRYLEIMKKTSKEKEKENLEKNITDMKIIKKMMEEDLNKYKIQGNKDSIKKIKLEIEKISDSIDELEEKLRELKK